MTESNDSLDLISILDTIVKNIKLILLFIACGVLVAFIYENLRSDRVNGKVEIFPILSQEELELAQIGYLIDSDINSLNGISNLGMQSFSQKLDASTLKQNFISYFLSSSILKNNFIRAYNLDAKSNLDLTKKFNIQKIVNSSTGIQQYYLNFKTTNKDKDFEILEETIVNINAQIFDDIKNFAIKINLMLDTFMKRKDQSLSDSLLVITENYQLKLARQKSFLQEHLKIAKALGIEMTNKQYISEIEESMFMQDTMFEEIYSEDIEAVKNKQLDILQLPYYLRGYVVIEKEIELLNNRSLESLELYDEEAAKVKIELNTLKLINSNITRTLDLLKNLGDFKAVLIDTDQITYTKSLPSIYLYMMIISLFSFIGIVFAIIRQSYSDYLKK